MGFPDGGMYTADVRRSIQQSTLFVGTNVYECEKCAPKYASVASSTSQCNQLKYPSVIGSNGNT